MCIRGYRIYLPMQETQERQVQSLGREDPLEEEMATHSCILAWKLGAYLVAQRLKICLECGRPGFDPWVGKIPWRRKLQPTPVLLPGESHGGRSLVGYSPWGRKDWDKTEQLSMHVNMCIPRIKDMQNSEFITPLRKYSKSHISQLS